MRRLGILAYGLICYLIFFGTFLYAIGWVGDLLVPRSIDSAPSGPLGTALVVDFLLLGLFAVQHRVLALPAFKRRWTQIIPKEAERSTYVLFASLALIAMFALWQPIGGTIWTVENPVARGLLYGLFFLGWGIVLVSTFLINHFDLFGLRQVWLQFRGKPYTKLHFGEPLFYRWVRHPLYVGFLLAFWSTPNMTAAHLVFAAATTGYILIAIQLEERDLVAEHGPSYERYRERVGMLLPKLGRGKSSDLAPGSAR